MVIERSVDHSSRDESSSRLGGPHAPDADIVASLASDDGVRWLDGRRDELDEWTAARVEGRAACRLPGPRTASRSSTTTSRASPNFVSTYRGNDGLDCRPADLDCPRDADLPRDRSRRRQHHLHLHPVRESCPRSSSRGPAGSACWAPWSRASCCCSRSPGSSG